jgi:WD40-like Beta Propeller Repeat
MMMVGGCAQAAPLALPLNQRLALPPQQVFISASWATPDVVILGDATLDNSRIGERLSSLALHGSGSTTASPTLLTLPDDPSCHLINDSTPTRLTDGRLVETRYCNGSGPDFTVNVVTFAGNFGPTLGDLGANNPSQISLNPSASQGVFGTSSDICAGIGFFGPAGVGAMPAVQVGSGNQMFRLNDALPTSDCTSTGNADDPDWSPDGTTIAFLASSAAVGTSGQARSDEPYDIELAAASDLSAGRVQTQLRMILNGLSRPGGLRWSPDGRWLVVAGNLAGRGPGTWLVRANDGQVRQASDLALRTPSWSPDGTHVAGIDNPDGSGKNANLVLIDVSALVGGG